MELAVAAYLAANTFPSSERFGLAAHIKKSATSVPSNIAEGHAQRGDRVFLRHIRIALGSLGELDTQLELARRLNLIDDGVASTLQAGITQTSKLLFGLRRALWIGVARTAARAVSLMIGSGGLLWLFE
jgi:four helix bundle protein